MFAVLCRSFVFINIEIRIWCERLSRKPRQARHSYQLGAWEDLSVTKTPQHGIPYWF